MKWTVFFAADRLCNKVEACEAQIEISLLRSESTNLKLEKVIDLLKNLSWYMSSIREQQNMLFRKQDILQSTLAGEVKVHLSDTPKSRQHSQSWHGPPCQSHHHHFHS